LREYTAIPSTGADGALLWMDAGASKDDTVVRPASSPFSASGGLKLLQGNLGRSVIKVSAVPDDRHVIEAPAASLTRKMRCTRLFSADELNQDMVCVVRWQGPQANGMPELHKLTPPLAVLQGKGFKVALVTDGRMSGASGKVPAAIHVSPEAAVGGPLAKVLDGDLIRVDAVAGTLQVLVNAAEWEARSAATLPELCEPPMAWAWAVSCLPACAATRRLPKKALAVGCNTRALTDHPAPPPFCQDPSMTTPAPFSALQVMQDAPVIPVIVLTDVAHAVPMARALVAGGVRMLEVTLRTPQALACIEAIAKAVPEAVVGAGTVRSRADAQAAAKPERVLR
jgi:hypothetical protein